MSQKRSRSVQNAPEAVQRVLKHLESHLPLTSTANSYDGLIAVPEVPWEDLENLGVLHRMDDAPGADALPSLLLETESGQVQIEICPFGPLVLLTSDGDADTNPIAQVLRDANLWPLFQNDLDSAGLWHGTPLARWLFPRRLTDAIALFDAQNQ